MLWNAVCDQRLAGQIIALLALGWISITPATASALSFTLNTELETGAMGPFTSIDLTENAGTLAFVITLDLDELGPSADLHEFYFNLTGNVTGLGISDTNSPNSPYALFASPTIAGGAGSSFDWGVSFGNGGGPPGNGRLQIAEFTLSANEDLTIEQLIESSFASGGNIEIDMAAHVQGTSLLTGASSETIGGVVPIPEPSTGLLFVAGLIGLAARRPYST